VEALLEALGALEEEIGVEEAVELASQIPDES
jgi:hypothetical protein